MFAKKAALSLLLALGFSGCVYANALTIDNQADNISTAIINHGACSTLLGDHGRSKPGVPNPIPEWILKIACVGHKDDCYADVYMQDNCQGPVVATAEFSIEDGIINITPLDSRYDVIGAPHSFYVVIKNHQSS